VTGTIVPPRRTEATRPAPVSDEDPRIAERRRGVAAHAKRRRRVVLAVVVGLLGLVALAVGLLRSPLFAVERVRVSGTTGVGHAEVIRASGVRRGDALVDVDPARVRAEVMSVPVVASARVEREWPHTVRITVTEEVPLATVAVAGRTLVVGRGGRTLGDAGSLSGVAVGNDLPRIVVADGVIGSVPKAGSVLPEQLMPVVALVEQLPPRLAARLQEVTVAADGSLTLTLGDGAGSVELGRAEDVPAKLLAVESVLAAVDLDCLDVLDVSDATRPRIRRRAGCAVGPPTVAAPTDRPNGQSDAQPDGQVTKPSAGQATKPSARQPTKPSAGQVTKPSAGQVTTTVAVGGRSGR